MKLHSSAVSKHVALVFYSVSIVDVECFVLWVNVEFIAVYRGHVVSLSVYRYHLRSLNWLWLANFVFTVNQSRKMKKISAHWPLLDRHRRSLPTRYRHRLFCGSWHFKHFLHHSTKRIYCYRLCQQSCNAFDDLTLTLWTLV